jgi:hypothetical protein
MDIHVLILYVYGYSNIQMSYNFLVGHTGLYRAFYNLIITIMPFVMKRYGRISAILVYRSTGPNIFSSFATAHHTAKGNEKLLLTHAHWFPC